MPATNLPVSAFGQVARYQREQELEYYLSKQYNRLGMRVHTRLNAFDEQFGADATAPSATVTINTSTTNQLSLSNQTGANVSHVTFATSVSTSNLNNSTNNLNNSSEN